MLSELFPAQSGRLIKRLLVLRDLRLASASAQKKVASTPGTQTRDLPPPNNLHLQSGLEVLDLGVQARAVRRALLNRRPRQDLNSETLVFVIHEAPLPIPNI